MKDYCKTLKFLCDMKTLNVKKRIHSKISSKKSHIIRKYTLSYSWKYNQMNAFLKNNIKYNLI